MRRESNVASVLTLLVLLLLPTRHADAQQPGSLLRDGTGYLSASWNAQGRSDRLGVVQPGPGALAYQIWDVATRTPTLRSAVQIFTPPPSSTTFLVGVAHLDLEADGRPALATQTWSGFISNVFATQLRGCTTDDCSGASQFETTLPQALWRGRARPEVGWVGGGLDTRVVGWLRRDTPAIEVWACGEETCTSRSARTLTPSVGVVTDSSAFFALRTTIGSAQTVLFHQATPDGEVPVAAVTRCAELSCGSTTSEPLSGHQWLAVSTRAVGAGTGGSDSVYAVSLQPAARRMHLWQCDDTCARLVSQPLRAEVIFETLSVGVGWVRATPTGAARAVVAYQSDENWEGTMTRVARTWICDDAACSTHLARRWDTSSLSLQGPPIVVQDLNATSATQSGILWSVGRDSSYLDRPALAGGVTLDRDIDGRQYCDHWVTASAGPSDTLADALSAIEAAPPLGWTPRVCFDLPPGAPAIEDIPRIERSVILDGTTQRGWDHDALLGPVTLSGAVSIGHDAAPPQVALRGLRFWRSAGGTARVSLSQQAAVQIQASRFQRLESEAPGSSATDALLWMDGVGEMQLDVGGPVRAMANVFAADSARVLSRPTRADGDDIPWAVRFQGNFVNVLPNRSGNIDDLAVSTLGRAQRGIEVVLPDPADQDDWCHVNVGGGLPGTGNWFAGLRTAVAVSVDHFREADPDRDTCAASIVGNTVWDSPDGPTGATFEVEGEGIFVSSNRLGQRQAGGTASPAAAAVRGQTLFYVRNLVVSNNVVFATRLANTQAALLNLNVASGSVGGVPRTGEIQDVEVTDNRCGIDDLAQLGPPDACTRGIRISGAAQRVIIGGGDLEDGNHFWQWLANDSLVTLDRGGAGGDGPATVTIANNFFADAPEGEGPTTPPTPALTLFTLSEGDGVCIGGVYEDDGECLPGAPNHFRGAWSISAGSATAGSPGLRDLSIVSHTLGGPADEAHRPGAFRLGLQGAVRDVVVGGPTPEHGNQIYSRIVTTLPFEAPISLAGDTNTEGVTVQHNVFSMRRGTGGSDTTPAIRFGSTPVAAQVLDNTFQTLGAALDASAAISPPFVMLRNAIDDTAAAPVVRRPSDPATAWSAAATQLLRQADGLLVRGWAPTNATLEIYAGTVDTRAQLQRVTTLQLAAANTTPPAERSGTNPYPHAAQQVDVLLSSASLDAVGVDLDDPEGVQLAVLLTWPTFGTAPLSAALPVPGPPVCGNGVVEQGETCDAGDDNGTTTCGCTTSCTYGVAATACEDGLFCTTGDACDGAGACVAGVGTPCAVPNALCDEGADRCVQCANDADCQDGNQCNGAEVCNAGVCQAGPPLVCDDGNVCNGNETCDDALGCVPGPPPVCDDGNACNGTETCDPALGCQAGPPLVCDDGNVCNGNETCDDTLGCVSAPPLLCDDGNACNGDEFCDPALGCQVGAPLVCDDGNVCNGNETCDPARGCEAGAPLVCDDGNLCNGNETCDPTLGCEAGVPPVCDDGQSCDPAAGGCTCPDGLFPSADGCAPCAPTDTGAVDLGCDVSLPYCAGTGATAQCVLCAPADDDETDWGCTDDLPFCITNAEDVRYCAGCGDDDETCVPCATDDDCPVSSCDLVAGTCEATCDDGLTNGGETDVDCGGPCAACEPDGDTGVGDADAGDSDAGDVEPDVSDAGTDASEDTDASLDADPDAATDAVDDDTNPSDVDATDDTGTTDTVDRDTDPTDTVDRDTDPTDTVDRDTDPTDTVDRDTDPTDTGATDTGADAPDTTTPDADASSPDASQPDAVGPDAGDVQTDGQGTDEEGDASTRRGAGGGGCATSPTPHGTWFVVLMGLLALARRRRAWPAPSANTITSRR